MHFYTMAKLKTKQKYNVNNHNSDVHTEILPFETLKSDSEGIAHAYTLSQTYVPV